jgi:ribosome recycling factor
MPLNQLGTVTVRDPQTLAVNLYDQTVSWSASCDRCWALQLDTTVFHQVGSKVVLAIQSAGLDLAPQLEGNGKMVIVPVPKWVTGPALLPFARRRRSHPCYSTANLAASR